MAKEKKIIINGEPFYVFYDRKTCDSAFSTRGDSHPAAITVGCKYASNKDIVNDLAHEIMEALLASDNKRWTDEFTDCGNEGVIFVFDHGYFRLFIPRFIDALLQTGRIQLDKSIKEQALLEPAKRKVFPVSSPRKGRKVQNKIGKGPVQ